MSTHERVLSKRIEKLLKTIEKLHMKIKELKESLGEAKRLETYLLSRNKELTLENIKLRD